MGKKKILTKSQEAILHALGETSLVRERFYLSGGTALAGFYLAHRFSEDLDFFSEQEVESQAVFVVLKTLPKEIGILKIDYEQSFNRHLFFLHLKKSVIKTEFTFFPFPRLERGMARYGCAIDSVMDIAVNKLFTIYQKPRARDFIDLYCIHKKYRHPIVDLVKKAKIKFDWHVDPIQLGTQFLLAGDVQDYPRMIQKLRPVDWQKFFFSEAKKLEKEIFS